MKKETREKYLYPAAVRAGVLIAVVLIFFIFFRFGEIKSGVSRIVEVLKPFLYGGVFAYLLKPSCCWFEVRIRSILDRFAPDLKRKDPLIRGGGIVISMALFLVIIYTFIALVIPQIVTSIGSILQVLPANINRASQWLEELARDNEQLKSLIESVTGMLITNLQDWLENSVMPNIQTVIAGVSTQVWNIVIAAKNILIGLVVCVYLLSCREKLLYQCRLLLLGIFGEKWSLRIREEMHIVDDMFEGFINGKLIDSLIIGILCFIVMSFLNWPYAVLVSTIIGVTNIIPFFGPFFGAVPSALLMLMESPAQMLYFLIFVLILQQFDGNILGPKILGNTTGLSSFWVLFSITFFGGLFGIAGMIIGVPLFAVIYDLVKKIIVYALKLRGISEEKQESLKRPKEEKGRND
ncbi:MAG: AI-2E family transporter [Lachnospiraceae bacterium]|nr:AI-2E family transporter [Lachnospiraceae bacterium]MDD7025139.1 AI-2E family transporter [Oscillospiraceae bacterium]